MHQPEAEADRCLVDGDVARAAVELARPLLQQFADDAALNPGGVIYVMILDPVSRPRDHHFEQAILYEGSFGRDQSKWDVDYSGLARDKARVAWRTNGDSIPDPGRQPQRPDEDGTLSLSSSDPDQVVVVVSGAQPAHDEALAGVIIMLLRYVAARFHKDRVYTTRRAPVAFATSQIR
jgi:hypothetical protein